MFVLWTWATAAWLKSPEVSTEEPQMDGPEKEAMDRSRRWRPGLETKSESIYSMHSPHPCHNTYHSIEDLRH
ncbi:hypothetical protein HDV57DRAFT_167651 [Trichoderma longibrachiatum]